MRGKQATKLRRLSRHLHAVMVASNQIDRPESREEVAFQRRRLYQMLKQRWQMLSRPKSLDSEIRSLMSNLGLPSLGTSGSNSSND